MPKTNNEQKLKEAVALLREYFDDEGVITFLGVPLGQFDKEDLIRIIAVTVKDGETLRKIMDSYSRLYCMVERQIPPEPLPSMEGDAE